jgi:hypothetical protein
LDEAAWSEAMIEFFTVLIIDYKLQNKDMETRVWFETERHCQAAMDNNLVEPLYNHLLDLYGNDMMMRCYVTEEASHDLVRPKLRPKGLK